MLYLRPKPIIAGRLLVVSVRLSVALSRLSSEAHVGKLQEMP